MPRGQAPPYPQKKPYSDTSHPYTEAPQEETGANQFEPGKAKALAEASMDLKDVRRNASDSRTGKRII